MRTLVPAQDRVVEEVENPMDETTEIDDEDPYPDARNRDGAEGLLQHFSRHARPWLAHHFP
jgi:hypothetical protein